MGDCNLDHYNTEETFCYPPWCSKCERGPQRRRSISETNEPCRRKSKELKTLIPKKHNRSQEYENMEFEYECKGQWQEKDMRYELTRIRSNLCELPTSYISNNCQVSNSLTNPKLSNDLGSFDCMKSFNTYDSPLKFVNDHIENLGDMQGKARLETLKLSPNKLEGSRVPRKTEARNGNYYKSPVKDQLNSKSEVLYNNFTMTKLKPDPNQPICNEYCSLADFKIHNLSSLKPVCFETSTYFNKTIDDTMPSDRHSRDMNRLREQLLSLKSSSYYSTLPKLYPEVEASHSINRPLLKNCSLNRSKIILSSNQNNVESTERTNFESQFMKKLVEEKSTANGDTLISTSKNIRNKISLKTRARLTSAKGKFKPKPKSVISFSTSSNCSESDCSGSDSENETNLDEVDNFSEPSTDESNKDSSDTLLSISTNEKGDVNIGIKSMETPALDAFKELLLKWREESEFTKKSFGDILDWFLRPSLFSNIPPYIRFNHHDYEGELKFPYSKKFFKWKLSTITPIIVRKTLTNSGFALVRKSNTWMGTWGKHMKSPLFKTLRETQKLNHFPGTFQLGRKDRLWRNFQRMILKFGMKEFGFLPHTYILPQEMKVLKQCWEYKNSNGSSDMWIIKPPASARGVGIKVINKWTQLPKKNSLVVQKYISNPYLINGSKFDLRLYVLVTSFHPLIIYLYPEGLARFASAKYSSDAKDLKDRYMHLTNYSINKLSSQYTANEDANSCEGHKWTLSKLLEVLQEQGVDTRSLWKNLQSLVIKTLIACEAPVVQLCEENMLSRYNCYELFGIDVLLDDKLKPWLLEVNISPSLHSASPLDAHVKGPLVKTLFDMAQFHLPTKVASQDGPQCFDPKIYTILLNRKEKNKHMLFEQLERRDEYLDTILKHLTGDDVRQLTRYEDENSVKGRFERIFPCHQAYKYLHFMEPRYYNRLFDAWEETYGYRREQGIALLRKLCDQKIHLKIPSQSNLTKNLPNTTPLDTNLPPSKMEENLPLEEIMKHATIDNEISLSV